MNAKSATATHNGSKMAGPLLRGGEIANAAIEAIEIDNPDKEIVIDDHRTYVRSRGRRRNDPPQEDHGRSAGPSLRNG